MQECGVFVDHTTIHRWALKILPVLAAAFRRHKRPVGNSWRMDETYVLVGGQWKYLYRAVDRDGATVDFLLTAKRDLAAVRRFLECTTGQHCLPDKVTIDKSGANTAAVKRTQADTGAPIELRQVKYLNNIVEQDHRAIKRIIRPMLGFQSFRYARILLAGIETMHMIKKDNLTASTCKLRLPQTSSILWLPDLSGATHICSPLLPYCNRTPVRSPRLLEPCQAGLQQGRGGHPEGSAIEGAAADPLRHADCETACRRGAQRKMGRQPVTAPARPL